jgi:hypothetical protein
MVLRRDIYKRRQEMAEMKTLRPSVAEADSYKNIWSLRDSDDGV